MFFYDFVDSDVIQGNIELKFLVIMKRSLQNCKNTKIIN